VQSGGEWHSQAAHWEKVGIIIQTYNLCATGELACTATYAEESAVAACAHAYQCEAGATSPCPAQSKLRLPCYLLAHLL
jgi:hypothetical protein